MFMARRENIDNFRKRFPPQTRMNPLIYKISIPARKGEKRPPLLIGSLKKQTAADSATICAVRK
jgi:hypothetical protein